jgi:stalled ribosome rescue protein Dom34
MTKNIGLWIDRKQAFIVREGAEKPEVIVSKVEPRIRYSGGTRIGGQYNQRVDSELRYNDRFQHQLREYYQSVIAAIRDAENILIFGPGEAKLELEREIQKFKPLAKKLLKVETADKMTEKQIVAYVRDFYKEKQEA